MGTPKGLEHALLSLPFDWKDSTIQGEYSLEYLADEVFPWVIGCTGLVKILLAIIYLVRRKLPRFPGPRTWLAGIRIYIGAAFDVLVCFGSLLRINFSYLYLGIVPFIVIFFIVGSGQEENPEACGDVKSGSSSTTSTDDGKKLMARSNKRNNQLAGTGDVKSGSSTKKMMSKKHKGKQNTAMPKEVHTVKTRVMSEEFYIPVLFMAPHFLLSVSGVVGDPDHDGNKYDIFYLFLFLTCMLQELTLIMISRGIAKASELLSKASLVVLLLTAHILAANAFGEKVVLLLLPEVVPLLLWFSLHLDRRTPIINIQNIKGGTEHIVLGPVLAAICGYIMVVPQDELRFYWAGWSCLASGVLIYILVLVLLLWPKKPGIATTSFEQVPDLLMFWGKVLMKAAAALFSFRVAVGLQSTVGP